MYIYKCVCVCTVYQIYDLYIYIYGTLRSLSALWACPGWQGSIYSTCVQCLFKSHRPNKRSPCVGPNFLLHLSLHPTAAPNVVWAWSAGRFDPSASGTQWNTPRQPKISTPHIRHGIAGRSPSPFPRLPGRGSKNKTWKIEVFPSGLGPGHCLCETYLCLCPRACGRMSVHRSPCWETLILSFSRPFFETGQLKQVRNATETWFLRSVAVHVYHQHIAIKLFKLTEVQAACHYATYEHSEFKKQELTQEAGWYQNSVARYDARLDLQCAACLYCIMRGRFSA